MLSVIGVGESKRGNVTAFFQYFRAANQTYKLRVAVIALWSTTLVVIFLRIASDPHRNTVFNTFETGGLHWLHGSILYDNYRGFVYSPLAAAIFVPFTLLPDAAADILWRLLNVAVYLGAVTWWLRAGLHETISAKNYAWVFLLLLPLSIGNLNNGQVNPLIIGLLMIALLAARETRWNLAALCIAITAYFKIYPLALGLVLVVLFPKQFTWRLLLALLLLGALTFVLQRPGYVLEQYRLWFATRLAGDRRLYKMSIAPRDLWMVLRLVHITVSERFYTGVQVLSGAGVALACLIGRRRNWPQDRILAMLLALVAAWMLLCGPATESATYILLAPPVVLMLVEAFSQNATLIMRAWIAASYGVLLFGLQLNSFFHLTKSVYTMSIQPVGALLFAGYIVAQMFRGSVDRPSSNDSALDLLSGKLRLNASHSEA